MLSAKILSLPIFILKGIHILVMLFVFIDEHWRPTRFQYHMMFASFNSSTTGVTRGVGTAYPCRAPTMFTLVYLWG